MCGGGEGNGPPKTRSETHLIRAPVPQGQDAQAKDKPWPWKVPTDGVPEDVERIRTGGVASFRGRHVVQRDDARDGLHVLVHEAFVASDFTESCKKSRTRSGVHKHDDTLQNLRPGALRCRQPRIKPITGKATLGGWRRQEAAGVQAPRGFVPTTRVSEPCDARVRPTYQTRPG